ncbi:MAG: exodeoxyribonuclease VII small subunit [Myxococcales bacterium]|nr:exodeoxyribonuclease VII small subunit [Myxococcales bacterium]MCB9566900.1 exodeoxyribonuclease VII small subunit [Myxococcales bacterium]MCB9704632.1 exodeoxyribonuclease VII small subunit [Myxococcales bacterium]
MARTKTTPTRRQASAEEASPPVAPEPLAIDEVLRKLESVVAELEGGEIPLEVALERFEVGVRLARQGGQLLDRIEERVEVLLADRDEVAPFAGGDEEDDD